MKLIPRQTDKNVQEHMRINILITKKLSLLSMFIITILIVGLFVIVSLIKYGNEPQTYTDIILEELGREFANKSIELFIYWAGMLIGLIILAGMMIKTKNETPNVCKLTDTKLVTACIVTIVAGMYIFYGNINPVLVIMGITVAVSAFISKENTLKVILLYCINLYAITGVYRIYALAGGRTAINIMFVSLLAMILSIMILTNNNINCNKAILCTQLLIPFGFLIYLTCNYKYNDEIVVIKPQNTVYIFIVMLIVISLSSVIYKIIKYWNCEDWTDSISAFISITVIALNRFSGSGFIMLNDMHHPAENTIAYNQIANLGRKAFLEYVPVSGLYSYVQGFFLEFFGNGNYTAYSISNNIYYLSVAILMIFAVRLHLNSALTFLLAVFLHLSDYSRVALIIPFMLILLSDRLVQKPLLWFGVWVLFGWCYGLYYPAYGVGIIVSMIPVMIYQLPRLIKSIKHNIVPGGGILTALLLIVLASFPLLVGTARHVLDMSDGMLYVDGVTVFGQALPNNFLSFLNSDDSLYTIRLIIGYCVRFMTPMIVVWIGFVSLFCIFRKKDGKGIKEYITGLDIGESSALACLIFPIICFYFSLYRMGANNLFNRASHIIVYSLVLIIIVLYKYGKTNFNKYALIIMSVFICTLGNSIGLNSLSGKYFAQYSVADDYVYTAERSDIPRLGEGFVQKDLFAQIENAASIYTNMDHERNYFALFSNGDHGMAYDAILNIRGTAMLETLVVRGYSISQDTAEKLLASNTIVGNRISPVDHYYLYKWLVSGGKYIWSDNEQVFYPVSDESDEEIRAANSKVIAGMATYDCGKYAASHGNSIETLRDVLTHNDIQFSLSSNEDVLELNFSEDINGNDIDFIFISADVGDKYTPLIYGENHSASNKMEELLMKHDYNQGMKVVVEWADDDGNVNSLKAQVQNGQLLLPIGAGVRWLSNNHSYIKIWFEQKDEKIKIPVVKDIRLYSVRDVDID